MGSTSLAVFPVRLELIDREPRADPQALRDMNARADDRLTIRMIAERDRPDWVRMRDVLWPGSRSDHEEETIEHFANAGSAQAVLVAELEGAIVGFLELDYRKYAPGCASSPVPFIEGWYVDPVFRRRGIGRALVGAAEAYSRKMGYDEIASDVALTNLDSAAAHRALGYEEVERVVYFRRSLRTGQRETYGS